MDTNQPKSPEKIPLFKSWKAWYLLVVGSLAFLILIFHLFTRYFS